MIRGTALGGAGLAAAALVGCGGEDEAAAPAATPAAGGATATATATAAPKDEIKRGGAMRVSQTSSISDIPDPHTSLAFAWFTWAYMGESMLQWSQDAKDLVPVLLESWEFSGDGTELTLNLRKGVKWHDKPPVSGREFDAEDVVYNIKRIGATLNLNEDEGKVFHRKSSMAGITEAVPVDAHTVKVTFEAPSSVFLNGLTNGRNSMVPREYPTQAPFEYENLVGTGAFQLDQWENEQRATFSRHPQYWREGRPYMDGVEWIWLPDAVSAQAAFAQGQVDFILANSPTIRGNLDKLVKSPVVVSWEGNNWAHFRFNATRKPFDDPRVRMALQRVVDVKRIADAQVGEGFWHFTGPLLSAFPEAIPGEEIGKLPGWNPATKEQDIAEAKKLMEAAGFADGKINFGILTSPGPGETAVRGVDMWKQVWPEIEPKLDQAADNATFGKRQGQGDFDVVQYGITIEGDAQLELFSNYGTKGGRNYGKFSNPKVDEDLETALHQIDREERKQTLLGLQDYIIEEQLPIITLYRQQIVYYQQPWLKGFVHGGALGGGTNFDWGREAHSIWLDK